MAFDILGPTKHAWIDYDLEETVLGMPEQYGVSCPRLRRIADHFFDDLFIPAARVRELRDEMELLLTRYRPEVEHRLRRKHKVHARDRRVERDIFDKLLPSDPVYLCLTRIRDVCDDALSTGQPIKCFSD